MSYTKQTWADGEAGGTPITAARLGHLEDGIEAAHETADAAAPLTHTHPDLATTVYVDALGTVADTGNTIVRRDANGWTMLNGVYGLADVAGEVATDIATNKGYVDALGTSLATPNTIVRRAPAVGGDSGGWAEFSVLGISSAPSLGHHTTRKDYVDGLIAGAEGIKTHDGTAGGGTRPTGYARVRWVGGTARPTNMAVGDIWEHDA